MIRKIVSVDNLGCLRRLRWHELAGEVGPAVGLFAPNGSGKTTLVAALRAARDGKARPLLERRSLPQRGESAVEILTARGALRYDEGKWIGRPPPLVIFDRAFVDANVYQGRTVGPDQRQQLYRLALGNGEVQAARRVDQAKRALNAASKSCKVFTKSLDARCDAIGLVLEELRRLEPLHQAPAELPAMQARLQALEASEDLHRLPPIEELPPPPALQSAGLRRLLDESATTLSTEATQAVRTHIEQHLDTSGEPWLRQGTGYAQHSPQCPYCGQSLASSSFAELLPRFFDDSYQRLRERIALGMERLGAWDRWVAELRSRERVNQQALRAWSAFVPLEDPPDLADLPQRAERMVALLRCLMADKQARLLEGFGSDARVKQVLEAYASLDGPLTRFGDWARTAATCCRGVAEDQPGTAQRLRQQVQRIQGRLLRGDSSVASDLAALDEAEHQVVLLSQDLQRAKLDLENRESWRTTEFLHSVNLVLADYGAGFRLRDLKGKASSSRVIADYSIALADQHGELEGSRIKASSKKANTPRFDTLLSEGDRTTLALAVFLTRSLDTPDQRRVIVLDDPLTSLDRSRRAVTARHIRQLAATSAQVWLMSHDAPFLRETLPPDASFLKLAAVPGGTALMPWDAQAEPHDRVPG